LYQLKFSLYITWSSCAARRPLANVRRDGSDTAARRTQPAGCGAVPCCDRHPKPSSAMPATEDELEAERRALSEVLAAVAEAESFAAAAPEAGSQQTAAEQPAAEKKTREAESFAAAAPEAGSQQTAAEQPAAERNAREAESFAAAAAPEAGNQQTAAEQPAADRNARKRPASPPRLSSPPQKRALAEPKQEFEEPKQKGAGETQPSTAVAGTDGADTLSPTARALLAIPPPLPRISPPQGLLGTRDRSAAAGATSAVVRRQQTAVQHPTASAAAWTNATTNSAPPKQLPAELKRRAEESKQKVARMGQLGRAVGGGPRAAAVSPTARPLLGVPKLGVPKAAQGWRPQQPKIPPPQQLLLARGRSSGPGITAPRAGLSVQAAAGQKSQQGQQPHQGQQPRHGQQPQQPQKSFITAVPWGKHVAGKLTSAATPKVFNTKAGPHVVAPRPGRTPSSGGGGCIAGAIAPKLRIHTLAKRPPSLPVLAQAGVTKAPIVSKPFDVNATKAKSVVLAAVAAASQAAGAAKALTASKGVSAAATGVGAGGTGAIAAATLAGIGSKAASAAVSMVAGAAGQDRPPVSINPGGVDSSIDLESIRATAEGSCGFKATPSQSERAGKGTSHSDGALSPSQRGCEGQGTSEQNRKDVVKLLQSVNLETFIDPLADLGVEGTSELHYVTDADLEKMGMTVIQRRKFKEIAASERVTALPKGSIAPSSSGGTTGRNARPSSRGRRRFHGPRPNRARSRSRDGGSRSRSRRPSRGARRSRNWDNVNSIPVGSGRSGPGSNRTNG